MSAASHLRMPVTGSAVPNDLGYDLPLAPERRGNPRRGKKTVRARRPLAVTWMGPMLTLGLCAALCMAVGIGLVAQKAKLMTLHYELNGLQAQLAEAEKERNYLQLALMEAGSPQRVEQEAHQRLGMSKPAHVEYLVLEGAGATEGELPPVVAEVDEASGPVAALGRWLTGNWPRWGKAEASPRP